MNQVGAVSVYVLLIRARSRGFICIVQFRHVAVDPRHNRSPSRSFYGQEGVLFDRSCCLGSRDSLRLIVAYRENPQC